MPEPVAPSPAKPKTPHVAVQRIAYTSLPAAAPTFRAAGALPHCCTTTDAPRRGRRPRRPASTHRRIPLYFHLSPRRGGALPRPFLLPPCLRRGEFRAPRARVTFGRSPKSDQKSCLKPQVSRLPARLAHAGTRRPVPRETENAARRRTTNRLYVSPRCRSHVPRGGTLLYQYKMAVRWAAPTLAAAGGKCAI